MTDKAQRLLAELLGACLLFAIGAAAGMTVLVALFKLGVAAHIDILFYRGVVLCGIAFVLTVALLSYVGRLTGRASFHDAITAGFLSVGLNLSFLVIAPVTVDRSVSIFILGHMAAHDGKAFTTDQIEAALRDVLFWRAAADRAAYARAADIGQHLANSRRLRHLDSGGRLREMGTMGRRAIRRRSAAASAQAREWPGRRAPEAEGRVVTAPAYHSSMAARLRSDSGS